jgi:hypothetical protein
VRASTADDYLEACGISTDGLSGTEIYDALLESAGNPVIAHVGWEERVEPDEAGNYADPRYKTGSFKNDEGVFVESFTTEDGEEIKARNVVTYFSRI